MELDSIALSDLLLDPANARLEDPADSQQSTILALAMQVGAPALIRQAEHIVEHGLDPSNNPIVVPTGDRKKRYTVLEGNRRLLALRALDMPSLVDSVLTRPQSRRLASLSKRFQENPIEEVTCAVFPSEEEASIWVFLRHAGRDGGVGTIGWGSDEKDRYAERHGKRDRSTGGQVVDFIARHGDVDLNSGTGIVSNITRLLTTPQAQEALGVTVKGGVVAALYPISEIKKGLDYVVNEFKSGNATVNDIYHAIDRRSFADAIPTSRRPNPSKRLEAPVPLRELTPDMKPSTSPTPTSPARSSRKRRPRVRERTTVIPRTCDLDIDPPRANAIYNELRQLPVTTFPNASAVLLRVFLELSVDHYLEKNNVMSEKARRDSPLVKRMKDAATHLHKANRMSGQMLETIQKVADSGRLLLASTITFNQYVHNIHTLPKPSEIMIGWDELQPFMERLWPV